ncbi:chemotaxis protein CheX [Marinobacterium arenosum]|uniref:chemotaxis protein CheX n=1 Tax=Marinobacterium arenosum TaxID=2862496 RepID=UPI001C94F7C3|nr:chemotaxis protein CheX [Marinobacterium arenosum]MBY4677135.1 chemotaxis protein CheX [Marinobacterium arenosum]
MKAELINPFLLAMDNVLSTMAGMECTPGKARLKNTTSTKGQVTGIIGMTGSRVKGSVAISFTTSVILSITERILGEKQSTINSTVIDMVGELTNMVTGGAKKQLSEIGYEFNMSTPVIVSAPIHKIEHASNAPTIVVTFATESGNFFIETNFSS